MWEVCVGAIDVAPSSPLCDHVVSSLSHQGVGGGVVVSRAVVAVIVHVTLCRHCIAGKYKISIFVVVFLT